MNNFAFVCGAPRSGTSLLMNLLEGHSQLATFPNRETHILEYWLQHKRCGNLEIFFYRDYLNSFDVLTFTSEHVLTQFSDYIFNKYGNNDTYKARILHREEFIKLYLDYLQRNGLSLRNIYYAIFNAALLINNLDIKNKIFIEKRPLTNEICSPMLATEFPEAKFIHIIRDPRTRYLSAKMRRLRNIKGIYKFIDNYEGKDFATAHAEISMVSLELARLNQTILQKRYHILRYEDLMHNTELEMRKIADFLKINFEPSLLQPSSLGKKTSPSSSILKISKSDVINTEKDRLARYYQNTSRTEQSVLRFLNWDIANFFKYDIEKMAFIKRSELILPLKYENPINYLPNRIKMFKNLLGYSWSAKSHHYHALINRFLQGVPVGD